ncbi:S-layer protein [Kribbella sp. NPDC004536]|uniref:S-layer protein n=1 Tax=Kribbella sp. NPDC004536 TaxID=3364106 RepID=UPI00367B61BD
MLDENRGLLRFGAVVLVMVLVVVGGVLLFRGGSDTKLTVTSIPSDLTLRLDGHEIPANGQVKVKSGRHTLEGSRRGFQSYTQTVDISGKGLDYRMYLYANSAEGREWAQKNPKQELELEREAGKHYDEMVARLRAKYPVMAYLPYVGDGFEATQAPSKSDPKNPEAISLAIEVYGPQGRTKALEWIHAYGWDLATLDIIWTTGK